MGICCMAQETHTGALYQPRGVGWGERGAAKSLQSCPTLCDPIDGSPTGSPVPGNFGKRVSNFITVSSIEIYYLVLSIRLRGGLPEAEMLFDLL